MDDEIEIPPVDDELFPEPTSEILPEPEASWFELPAVEPEAVLIDSTPDVSGMPVPTAPAPADPFSLPADVMEA
jgi:hypothetical protein